MFICTVRETQGTTERPLCETAVLGLRVVHSPPKSIPRGLGEPVPRCMGSGRRARGSEVHGSGYRWRVAGGSQEERSCRKCHEFSARLFLPLSLAPARPPITLPPAQGAIEKGQNKRGLMRLPRRLWVCPRQLPVARYGYSLPGLPGRKSS